MKANYIKINEDILKEVIKGFLASVNEKRKRRFRGLDEKIDVTKKAKDSTPEEIIKITLTDTGQKNIYIKEEIIRLIKAISWDMSCSYCIAKTRSCEVGCENMITQELKNKQRRIKNENTKRN